MCIVCDFLTARRTNDIEMTALRLPDYGSAVRGRRTRAERRERPAARELTADTSGRTAEPSCSERRDESHRSDVSH
jgi:hypothetical protein